jgi:hypothetical protein
MYCFPKAQSQTHVMPTACSGSGIISAEADSALLASGLFVRGCSLPPALLTNHLPGVFSFSPLDVRVLIWMAFSAGRYDCFVCFVCNNSLTKSLATRLRIIQPSLSGSDDHIMPKFNKCLISGNVETKNQSTGCLPCLPHDSHACPPLYTATEAAHPLPKFPYSLLDPQCHPTNLGLWPVESLGLLGLGPRSNHTEFLFVDPTMRVLFVRLNSHIVATILTT